MDLFHSWRHALSLNLSGLRLYSDRETQLRVGLRVSCYSLLLSGSIAQRRHDTDGTIRTRRDETRRYVKACKRRDHGPAQPSPDLSTPGAQPNLPSCPPSLPCPWFLATTRAAKLQRAQASQGSKPPTLEPAGSLSTRSRQPALRVQPRHFHPLSRPACDPPARAISRAWTPDPPRAPCYGDACVGTALVYDGQPH